MLTSPKNSLRPDDLSREAWFCVRTQPRHEAISARHLQQMHGVETFNPTIEVQRRGRGKLVWVRESLFGCYIFARFDFHLLLEKIRFTPGVSSLVHFGGETPTVSDEDIDHLKATFGESERVSLASKLQEGDSVTILRGPFEGIEATIIRTMPSAKRVQVLMEFLGRTTSIDVALDSVFGR